MPARRRAQTGEQCLRAEPVCAKKRRKLRQMSSACARKSKKLRKVSSDCPQKRRKLRKVSSVCAQKSRKLRKVSSVCRGFPQDCALTVQRALPARFCINRAEGSARKACIDCAEGSARALPHQRLHGPGGASNPDWVPLLLEVRPPSVLFCQKLSLWTRRRSRTPQSLSKSSLLSFETGSTKSFLRSSSESEEIWDGAR